MPHLPRARKDLSIRSFDGSLADTGNTCDLRRLTFIDAYGLVALACALRAARADAGLRVVSPRSPATASHLAAMGLGDFLSMIDLTGLPTTPTIDAEGVVVALQSTTDTGGAQALSNLLWEQLRAHVLETQGRMIVRSGTAKVSLTAEDRTAESVPFLPGVIVALSLPLYPG